MADTHEPVVTESSTQAESTGPRPAGQQAGQQGGQQTGQQGGQQAGQQAAQQSGLQGGQDASAGAHAVTGAFGFTGKYLARRLLDSGKRVVTLTGSPDRPNPFEGKVEARPFDFSRAEAMVDALKGVEVLYNTYWVRFNHELFSHSSAVRNTLVLFEAAKMAGVRRIVHVSITNADTASPHEYFSAKGHLEKALAAMFGQEGRSHAIVRPAVLFGPEDILINNIAWALRRLPVFGVFGNGEYPIRPIHVDDLAAIMAQEGAGQENTLVNALGAEEYTYRSLVETICRAIGKKRRIVQVPPDSAYSFSRILSYLLGDVLITKEEIAALMEGLLDVQGAEPTGETALSSWVAENAAAVGRRYHSELDRRKNRSSQYA